MSLPSKASARDRLAALLAPEVIDALDEFVAERVAAELACLDSGCDNDPAWLTVKQAGKRLDCSSDAVRMRAARGRLETRRHGRRLYVSAASVANLG